MTEYEKKETPIELPTPLENLTPKQLEKRRQIIESYAKHVKPKAWTTAPAALTSPKKNTN